MEERLQKIMAQAGLGSRRACELLITAGRVTVNGQKAVLGQKADPSSDRILVDGQLVKVNNELVYIALHKPRGVVSTAEEEFGRPTVLDLVPVDARLYPVGRLDMESEGLVLLTNDGELAHKLSHPRFGHQKEYRVLIARQPEPQQLEAWRHGVVLEDGYRTAPAEVIVDSTYGKGAWLRVILNEGRKRQIREMGSRTGLPVVRIVRIRIGALRLGSMKVREWRHLTPAEVTALKEPAAAPKRQSAPRKKRAVGRPQRPPNKGQRKPVEGQQRSGGNRQRKK